MMEIKQEEIAKAKEEADRREPIFFKLLKGFVGLFLIAIPVSVFVFLFWTFFSLKPHVYEDGRTDSAFPVEW